MARCSTYFPRVVCPRSSTLWNVGQPKADAKCPTSILLPDFQPVSVTTSTQPGQLHAIILPSTAVCHFITSCSTIVDSFRKRRHWPKVMPTVCQTVWPRKFRWSAHPPVVANSLPHSARQEYRCRLSHQLRLAIKRIHRQ